MQTTVIAAGPGARGVPVLPRREGLRVRLHHVPCAAVVVSAPDVHQPIAAETAFIVSES
jgi:hypothetical protein